MPICRTTKQRVRSHRPHMCGERKSCSVVVRGRLFAKKPSFFAFWQAQSSFCKGKHPRLTSYEQVVRRMCVGTWQTDLRYSCTYHFPSLQQNLWWTKVGVPTFGHAFLQQEEEPDPRLPPKMQRRSSAEEGRQEIWRLHSAFQWYTQTVGASALGSSL